MKTKTDDIKEINNFYVNKIGKNIMIKKKHHDLIEQESYFKKFKL